MKTFRLFSMAALALVMAACGSEDNALGNATPAKPGLIPFSATVAPLSGATTRTVYTPGTDGESKPIINVTWKEGDQICIIGLGDDFGRTSTVTVGKPNGDGSAPLSGNISGTDDSEIEAQYPASAYDDWGIFTDKYKAQDGTLSGIQDNLDYRKGTGKISVIDGKATLATALQMESQIAIWKLTLQNTSGANLNATKVTIKDGSDIIAATKDISATSEVHMAVPFNTSPTTFNSLTIEATTADGTYTYAAPSAVNLSQSTYYQSTVKMAKALTYPIALSAVTADYVGSVVTTDGKVYAKVSDATTAGKTAAAMIAYVGNASDCTHGLAIALADERGSMDWNTAKSTCEGKTAVTGETWRLPSAKDWQYMFIGCGSGETYSDPSSGMSRSYSGLASKLTIAGGTAFKWNEYCSSSVDLPSNKVWDLFFVDDSNAKFYFANEDVGYFVRACLAF